MLGRRDLWLLLPRPVRRLPADLAAVVLLTLLTLASVFIPIVNETPLRVVFGLAFVLFLPGYAFIAALFPEEGESPTTSEAGGTAASEPDTDDGDDADGPAPVPGTAAAEEATAETADTSADDPTARAGIDGIERVALSFGLSIAIVPLIGLVLNFTPWGIRLVPIAVSVSLFTLGCVVVAAVRRWELPPEERFVVPYREWIAAGKAEVFEPEDRTDAALNVVLGLSMLLAVGSVGYAVAVPQDGEQFTEFYLLTEQPDGELVADDYPEELALNESAELIVGIGNNEHSTQNYTVVVQLQEVTVEGNTSTVERREELGRYGTTLEHNATDQRPFVVEPTFTGTELRVQFLLYMGEAPASPTRENAYRDLHLWMNVSNPQ
ncbi:hypothetical protein GCM10027435_02950 [Haloparvum alkalitolerans]|uniref:DUF1616 domain-containing protein n=1 Tax=Haloparvum alkalitolerans TaxID=1042953 RepID=UPI003CF76E36